MKRLFALTLVWLGVQFFLAAQGTIAFVNRWILPEIDAPVFEVDGVTPLAGKAYLAQLWAGSTSIPFRPINEPVPFRDDRPGYWKGVTRVIDFIAPGSPGQFQVRVWRAADGATFEQAKANGVYGFSNILALKTGGVPGMEFNFPEPLIGLQSFSLIPEPAPWVLAVLGTLLLLFHSLRRKAQS